MHEIADDLGVSRESLRIWVKQPAIDAGEQSGLTSEEQEELRRLRRENRVLRQECEILKKAAVPSLPRRATAGSGLPLRRCAEGRPLRQTTVPRARRLPLGLLCLGASRALRPRPG